MVEFEKPQRRLSEFPLSHSTMAATAFEGAARLVYVPVMLWRAESVALALTGAFVLTVPVTVVLRFAAVS